MLHHYIDQEEKDGKYYAVSWLEIGLFRYSFIFSEKRIRI